jgi:hypothetical protein
VIFSLEISMEGDPVISLGPFFKASHCTDKIEQAHARMRELKKSGTIKMMMDKITITELKLETQ